MKSLTRKRLLTGCGALLGLCLVCITGAAIYNATPAGKAASTARSLTETAAPTETPRPTRTLPPTKTTRPTNTARPTNTPQPAKTATDEPTATQQPTLIPPTQPSRSGEIPICACDNSLSCGDFNRQKQAQACFDYCRSQGYDDPNHLDGNDKDGKACESLP